MIRLACLLVLVATLQPAQPLLAQTSPQIGYLFPAGAQRGSQVNVIMGGKYMPGPCGVWVGGLGVRSNNPTTEGAMQLTIDPNAPVGVRPVRIHSVQGASTARAFIVGELPEIVENPEVDRQPITPRITVNGRLNPKGDVDQFELSLKAGQQIVCAAAVAALGSPGDTILRLLDSTGRVVASADDQRGLDPLLVYRCASPGKFTLQIFDFNLAGGANSVYRLTVTDGPYLDYAFPAGVQRGVDSKVTLHGWNLPNGETASHTVKATGESHVVTLAGAANQLVVPVVDSPVAIESEPNNAPATAQVIGLAQVIGGRIDKPGDVDVFRITAKKGDRLLIKVDSNRLGFPTDLLLKVAKGDGTLIKEIDDAGGSRDPEYVLTIPADGEFLLTLRERALRGGPRFIYRMQVRSQVDSPKPSLRISVKTAEFAVIPGESLEIPVRVEPIEGFAEEIELMAVDLPAGVTVEAVKHTPKKTGNVSLTLKAASGAGFVSGPFKIVARSVDGAVEKKTFTSAQSAKPTISAPVALWLAVRPRVPFELLTASTIQESPRLAAKAFPVSVKRDEGFHSRIRLVGVDPDRRGTVVPLSGEILKNADAGMIPLIIQSGVTEGTTHRCRVMGVVNVKGPDGKLYSVFHVAKGSMMLGCQPNLLTLTASPTQATWQPGQSILVTVTIGRRAEFGKVTVSLSPAKGVQAKPVMIPVGQSQASLVVTIAPDVKRAPESALQLQAEASRNGLPIYARAKLRLVPR
jgi:hypothetical protein